MVSYTKEQRARAAKDGTVLVTVDVPGVRFQGPVPADVAASLTQWLTEMFRMRWGIEEPEATQVPQPESR